ncbi:uncharacterized protein RBU33_022958 [Hipposideros larvatus]
MLELWLSGKQWPRGLPRLREPLPGCTAPSRIGASTLSRRSWRSGGAAAAADSARLGHLSSLSLTQTSRLQLSSIAIGLTQRAGTSGERRAHWLRGARRSCSDYHISALPPPGATDRSASPRERIRAPRGHLLGASPRSPDARAARLLWLLASLSCSSSSSSSACPLPRSFPAAPPAPWPPVALLLRPALLGSPQSGWPCCARGSLFCRRWRVAGWISPLIRVVSSQPASGLVCMDWLLQSPKRSEDA